MTCIVSFNASLLLVNNQSVNSLGIDRLTFRCAKSSNKSYKYFNTKNSGLRLSKDTILGRKWSVVKAFWNWFEAAEDKNDKYTFVGEIPEFNSVADFTRLRKNEIGGDDLQTAVVRYRNKFPWSILQPGVQVDLVAAVHIADKE